MRNRPSWSVVVNCGSRPRLSGTGHGSPGPAEYPTVYPTTGEPLVGYTVGYSAGPGLPWPVPDKRGRLPQFTTTDQDGRFRILDLPAGVPLYFYACPPKSGFESIR